MSTENDSLFPGCRNPFKPHIDLSSAEFMDAPFEPSITEVQAMLSLDQDSTVSDHAHRVTTDPAGESQQSLISPLRRLPNEIIARIFEYTCEENFLQEFPWHDIDYPSTTPTKLTLPVITYLPAMTISSVCSRWRQLALSYPGLWSNLRVEICILSRQDDINGFIATLNRYLEVSGNYPLNLELNILGQPLWPAEPLAVDCLVCHAHRWKRFTYMGDYTLTDYGILSDLHFPILTDLTLAADYNIITSTDLDCFKHAPNLRALRTDAFDSSAIPYHQLQRANFGIFDHDDMEDIIQECPFLTSLEVIGSEDISEFPTSPSSHSILSLCIHENSRGRECFYNLLFSCFNFPLLRELNIIGDDNERYVRHWPRKAFDSFISRSACTITTFTIHHVPLSDEELVAALRIMPSLTDLEINDKKLSSDRVSPITSQLISSLRRQCIIPEHARVPTGSNMHLVPSLRSLRLVFKGMVFDDNVFIETVQSRWLPDSDYAMTVGVDCLRSVVLKFCHREVDEEVYKPLYDLDKMGMRVVVSGTEGTKI